MTDSPESVVRYSPLPVPTMKMLLSTGWNQLQLTVPGRSAAPSSHQSTRSSESNPPSWLPHKALASITTYAKVMTPITMMMPISMNAG